MPAMAEIKKRAQAVLCKNNLKNLAILTTVYTSENDGLFWVGAGCKPNGNANDWKTWVWDANDQWMAALGKLASETGDSRAYVDEWEYRCCPMAKKPKFSVGITMGGLPAGERWWPVAEDAAIRAWGALAVDITDRWAEPNVFGSYGVNAWVRSVPRGTTSIWNEDYARPGFKNTEQAMWKRTDVKGGDKVPVLMDATWFGIWADTDNNPPSYEGEFDDPIAIQDEIKRACINRHNQAINVTYMDSSVRTTALKQLWKVKWNRSTVISDANLPNWSKQAKWMLNFRKD